MLIYEQTKSLSFRMGRTQALDTDAAQKTALSSLGNILGDKSLEQTTGNDLMTTSVDFGSFMKTFHRKQAEHDPNNTKPWQCPFPRDKVLELWKMNHNSLKDDDERAVHRLLLKYHGPYTEEIVQLINKYEKMEQEKKNQNFILPSELLQLQSSTTSSAKNAHAGAGAVVAIDKSAQLNSPSSSLVATGMSNVTYNNNSIAAGEVFSSTSEKLKAVPGNTTSAAVKISDGKGGHVVQWDRAGKTITTDVDLRCRQIQREIDRVGAAVSPLVDSDVLTGTSQRVLKSILYDALNDELDYILMEQIRERERSRSKRLFESFDADHKDDDDSDDDDDNYEDLVSEDEDFNSDNEDGNTAMSMHQALLKRVTKRAARRHRRRLRLKKASTEDEILNARKMIKTQNKSGQALAEAILQNQLGVGGCLACRATTCKYVV